MDLKALFSDLSSSFNDTTPGVPLFTCSEWDSKSKFEIVFYCSADKLQLLSDLVLLGLVVYQMYVLIK